MTAPAEHSDTCITCGDVAIELVVVEASDHDAWCEAADGGCERVATDLVGEVRPGQRLLVHAAVAIARIEGQ